MCSLCNVCVGNQLYWILENMCLLEPMKLAVNVRDLVRMEKKLAWRNKIASNTYHSRAMEKCAIYMKDTAKKSTDLLIQLVFTFTKPNNGKSRKYVK